MNLGSKRIAFNYSLWLCIVSVFVAWEDAAARVRGLGPNELQAETSQLATPQESNDEFPAVRIEPFEPQGFLFLVGGGRISPEIRREFARLGGADRPDSRFVIVPTASATADDPAQDWREPWNELGFHQIEIVHSRDREVANSESFVEPLRRATAIWLVGGDQSRLAAAYGGTLFEQVLQEKLHSGAVVGGTSAGAAIASRVMIAGGRETPELASGFDLLPAAILDQHFSQRQRRGRLQLAVERHPACVGVGIDESTALVVHQRQLRILGEGRVHLCFSATAYSAAEHVELRSGQRGLDWTTIVRSNRERHLPPFPVQQTGSDPEIREFLPKTSPRREVPKGSLLIVGGGAATQDIWATFVERAGGPAARIVVLPTAVPAAELARTENRSGEARVFRRLGVADVQVLPETDFTTVNSDAFCQLLSQATGIWFGGGRQWRFVDAYENTRAVAAMHDCLERGGIIGGSSAGASIQGELLIRGAPVGNQIMVQDGYRRGFGFLPGVGIDQHFAQRNRFRDLEETIRRFPSILGVGIDESTALLVEKDQGQVLGRGAVYFYSADHLEAQPTDLAVSEKPIKVASGQTIDLNRLQIQVQK